MDPINFYKKITFNNIDKLILKFIIYKAIVKFLVIFYYDLFNIVSI